MNLISTTDSEIMDIGLLLWTGDDSGVNYPMSSWIFFAEVEVEGVILRHFYSLSFFMLKSSKGAAHGFRTAEQF